jgi:hypothetical protein
MAEAHAARLAALGFGDDAQLAAAIRAGTVVDARHDVGALLATAARDQLLVANPAYLETASA